MPERPPNPEVEPNELDLPSLLDIVKLDGRWAQVLSRGADSSAVHYLDDDTQAHIDWSDYELIVRTEATWVRHLMGSGSMSQEEFSRVRWEAGPPQPQLQQLVRVFGEFQRKGSS